MDDIELEDKLGIQTTSDTIVEEINDLIMILLKLNPSYKPVLWRFNESDWTPEHKKQKLKERRRYEFFLKDTY